MRHLDGAGSSGEIRAQRQHFRNVLEALGKPEFAANGIVPFDQDERTGYPARPEPRKAHRQDLLARALATEFRGHCQVINQAAAPVVAAERGADNRPAAHCGVAQARVAAEVADECLPVVPLRHFHAVAAPPKPHNLVIVEGPERAEFQFSLHIPIRAYTYYGMNLASLKTNLLGNPARNIRLILPDGDPIPADFHVTEVGHVVKNFIDCGGTVRRQETCLLQAWVAGNDPDHRLTAEKLNKILELSAKVMPRDDLDVEVEYEPCAVAQYRIEGAEAAGDELRFQLAHKHTDCLAREACGLSAADSGCGCGEAGGKCC
jgi:hypothetical protein